MLLELKEQANLTQTENGAMAYRSTHSACLDLFAVSGALRHADAHSIVQKFRRAYGEDPDTAMRILFYSRDVREGLGERRFFRIAVRDLANTHPDSVLRNLSLFAEYGRYDDLLCLLDTPCEAAAAALIRDQLNADLAAAKSGKNVSLLAKWLPSVNTSSPETRAQAKQVCRLLGMRQKEYRRTLASLRASIGIVEDSLRRGDYNFDYASMPGGAMLKYRRAILKHAGAHYRSYLINVKAGKAKMNTGNLYPYEIIRRAHFETDPAMVESLDTMWNALPDFTDNRNALAVIDGSGSMYWSLEEGGVRPIDIALSLGLYFAEHNRGHFAGHFITFSETPRLVQVRGSNIAARVWYCSAFDEAANTNLYNTFMLILTTAIRHKLPQSELPELLYIISDMEFDVGVSRDKTVFEDVREKFEEWGYKMPQLVYWNVDARNEQYPVKMDTHGTALVSGASPRLFEQMMSQELTPYSMMEQVLSSERYAAICA